MTESELTECVVDRIRLDRIRVDRIRLDRIRLDRIKFDRIRLDRIYFIAKFPIFGNTNFRILHQKREFKPLFPKCAEQHKYLAKS